MRPFAAWFKPSALEQLIEHSQPAAGYRGAMFDEQFGSATLELFHACPTPCTTSHPLEVTGVGGIIIFVRHRMVLVGPVCFCVFDPKFRHRTNSCAHRVAISTSLFITRRSVTRRKSAGNAHVGVGSGDLVEGGLPYTRNIDDWSRLKRRGSSTQRTTTQPFLKFYPPSSEVFDLARGAPVSLFCFYLLTLVVLYTLYRFLSIPVFR